MTDWTPRGIAPLVEMIGYDTADGFEAQPLDNRDDENPDWEIDPQLSCSNTGFGGDDPAKTEVKNERVFYDE